MSEEKYKVDVDERYRRRLLVSVDARGYGSSDDLRQDEIQRMLPSVLDAAAGRARLHRDRWDCQPAGDGELAVLPDSESEPDVVDAYVRELVRELADVNRGLRQEVRLRLRLAVHHGMSKPARMGYSGQGVVEVSRLADSSVARAALEASGADLVLILSQRIFEDSVQQPHTSLSVDQFRRVEVSNKELHVAAWIHVPGHDVQELDLDSPMDDQPAAGTGKKNGKNRDKRGTTVKTVFRDATMYHTNIGIVGPE